MGEDQRCDRGIWGAVATRICPAWVGLCKQEAIWLPTCTLLSCSLFIYAKWYRVGASLGLLGGLCPQEVEQGIRYRRLGPVRPRSPVARPRPRTISSS
jgi:hypothetical protein